MNEILTLINSGESSELEFKTSFQKEVIEIIVAFANSKGGKIIIGVSNERTVTGVALSYETIQGYINTIKQSTAPSIIVDIEITQIRNKNILIIQVDEYPI